MGTTIKFDTSGKPESPTIILSKQNGEKIDVLHNSYEIHFNEMLNAPSECSFAYPKYINNKLSPLWREIKDFRIIYVPEWKKRFSITVNLNEDNEDIKHVSGVSLCENELSQLNLYEVDINTESDIARKDYERTVVYDKSNPKASLLNRILNDKAPHYKILHVDNTIANLQRTFSFDDVSIYNALMEIADEIHCLFVFGEETENGYFRTISAYDLESYCYDCNNRGEFYDKCPKCGSLNISEGYGEDTPLVITNENLAENIECSVNTDAVKNCFRLEAGDDIMTAAIVNSNPSGSAYLWNITPEMKYDMSDGLVSKLNQYEQEYKRYQNSHEFQLNPTVVSNYNNTVKKYQKYDSKLSIITNPITGYQSLMKAYYDTIDFDGYLRNTLMPSVKLEQTFAKDQIKLLIAENLSPISVENIKYISLATANSAILSYAKVYIDSAKFRVKIKESSISGVAWKGSFTVTSYFDDEDTADSPQITIIFNNDYENFLKQKLDKVLSKEKEDISIIGLFKKDETAFSLELQKYCLSYLLIFQEACEACLNILIEQGVPDKDSWNSSSNPESDLYGKLYQPYFKKKELIEQEIQTRENELVTISGKYDINNNLVLEGLHTILEKERNIVLKKLNFQNYLGSYWTEFSTFRREDTWKNDNYISDGLDNAEVFKKAKEFLDVANKELIKSSTLQHHISTTLKNLLVMCPFVDVRKYFSIGNWLRLIVDGGVYKLRLISYEINYDNLDIIPVEFSDVLTGTTISDIESILNQSQSISTSYNSIKRQAAQGEESNQTLKNWTEKGLDASVTKIVNSADNQDIVYDKNGMLFRKYDEFLGTYSPIQLKIINSSIAMTTDGWKTSKMGVGKFSYYDPKDNQMKDGYGIIANQLIGGLLLSEEIGIYNKTGSMTFDDKFGLKISNKTNTVTINPNETNLFVIDKGSQKIFYVDDTGNLNIQGTLSAASGSKIGYWGIGNDAIYNTNPNWGASNGKYFGDHGLSISDKFKVDAFGNVTASGTLSLANGKFNFSDNNLVVQADVATDNLRATGGILANLTISSGYLYNGISIGKAGSCGISAGTANGGSDDRIFWAGNDNFRVTKEGRFYSNDAQLSGGKIGSLNITPTGLYAGQNNFNAGIDAEATYPAFWSGSSYTHRKTAPFQVSYDGKLSAPEVKINTSVGSVFIGNSNDTGIDTVSILPNKDNTGSIGSPTKRWNAIYGNVISQLPPPARINNKPFNIQSAYLELKKMNLYSAPSSFNNNSISIDFLPKSIQFNNTYILNDLVYWSIAVMKAAQEKISALENKILQLEKMENGK